MKQNTVVRLLVLCNNKVLLLHRLKDKQIHPDQEELVGGKVDFGESVERALERECQEELGRSFTDVQFRKHYSYVAGDRHAIGICFLVILSEEFSPTLSSTEHDGFRWARFDELAAADISSETKIILEEYLDNNDAKKSTNIPEVKLYTDGGSRGNPGPSSSGYAIFDMDGSEIEKGGEYLGITTNNQAEYQAVKLGLERAKKLGAHVVHGHMDSLLVVNQMNGIYKIKNRELWPIHQAIKDLKSSFDKVTFTHVPREMNKIADEQVNIILDSEAGAK